MLKLKEVSIEIISKCPSKCLHCSSFSSSGCSELIALDKFIEVVDDAQRLGAHTICLSGGEPFLHPDIIPMIEHVNGRGLKSYIYTSGVTFDDNGMHSPLPQIVLECLTGKVSKLIFNIESSKQQAYNKIMGTQGCFPLLKSSVINAVRYKINCEAHFVPMKLNVGQIYSTYQLCEEWGIAQISFLRLVLHGRAKDNKEQILLDDNELESLKPELAALAKWAENRSCKVRVGVPFLLSNSKNAQNCEAANGKLNIKYDGNVYPCEVFKNDAVKSGLNGLTPGNILHERLYDIYNNSEYLKMVRRYVAKHLCQNGCETCVGQHMISNLATNKDCDGNVCPCEVFKNDTIKSGLNGLIPGNILIERLEDIYKNSEYLKKVRHYGEEHSCQNGCETCVGQHMIKNAAVNKGGDYAQK